MKAQVLYDIGDLRYEDIEKPQLKEGWVMVKVMAAGVCLKTEENLIFHSLFLILDDTELMYSDREGLWHVPCVL